MKESTKTMILASFETWTNGRGDVEKTKEENELSNTFLEAKLTAKEFIDIEEKIFNYVEVQNKVAYAAGFEACFKMLMDLR